MAGYKYKAGDKFLLEITAIKPDTYRHNGVDYPYKMEISDKRNCNCEYIWNYKESQLDSLEKVDMTPEEAWEVARKILPIQGGLSSDELEEIFGSSDAVEIIKKFDQREAKVKIEVWEKSKEIKIGDIVEYKEGTRAVVLDLEFEETATVYTENGCVEEPGRKTLKRTGKNVDIQNLILNQIGGES